jgi:hypothetical protein
MQSTALFLLVMLTYNTSLSQPQQADAKSCNDKLDDCVKPVKTHPTDDNGCMPVQCKVDSVDSFFRYVKDANLKKFALDLENDTPYSGPEIEQEHPPDNDEQPPPP